MYQNEHNELFAAIRAGKTIDNSDYMCKSTLLAMLSGEIAPETGAVRRGRGARVGALPQLPVLASGTVRDVQLALNAIMEKNGKPHAESMDLRSHVKAAVATGLPAGRYRATTHNGKPHIERVGSVRGRK